MMNILLDITNFFFVILNIFFETIDIMFEFINRMLEKSHTFLHPVQFLMFQELKMAIKYLGKRYGQKDVSF